MAEGLKAMDANTGEFESLTEEELKQVIQILKKENQDGREKNKVLKDECAGLKFELTDAKNHIESLKKEIESWKQEANYLHDMLDENANRYSIDIGELEEKYSISLTINKDLTAENEALKKELDAMRKMYEEINGKYETKEIAYRQNEKTLIRAQSYLNGYKEAIRDFYFTSKD